MKKFAVIIITLLSAISCTNLDEVWAELRDHEERIQRLEALCNRLNSNVEAIQTILTALEQNDYVTDIVKVVEDGVEVGYSITFAKGGTVTIYHGTDGSDGADGAAPQISIKKAQDGEYYWTADGEWMTDENGERIPAVVADDPDGEYITPQFRVADGKWYVSYDNGNSWLEIDGVSNEEEEGDQFFSEVTVDEEYIHFTLSDGTVISIPRGLEPADKAVEYPFSYDGYLGPNGVLTPTSSPGAGSSNVTRTTEYIDITDAKSIYYHGRMGPVSNYYSVGFYDADKNFIEELSISGTGNIETYYITLDEKYDEAVYVRGSWAKGPNLQIEDTYDFIFIIDGKPATPTIPEIPGTSDGPKKRFAVLGDSIGTHGNSGEYCNVVEVEIMPEDVGVELNAYLTYYDVHDTNNGSSPTGSAIEFTLGGQTFTEADNGKLITFTPTAEDIGKKVGKVYNYNPNSLKTWWLWLAEAYNMEPIPVCWSSSSISSHETTTPRLVNSYAWHDSQVRKCGVRIPGSNDRIAPDYIIIARGCNDWSHGKGTLITDGYFDSPETWTYPMTDEVGTYYGIKEAVSLTVKNMREAYPKAKIYLCTITYNNRGSKDTFPPCYGGKSMVSFNRAIRECAEFFGCGLIDLASCGVTHENLKTYAPDGTHLNASGHELAGMKAIADFGSQETDLYW